MAHYLVVTGDNPSLAQQVEAKSLREAIEALDLGDGESATVYRVLSEPKIVRMKTATVRTVEID